MTVQNGEVRKPEIPEGDKFLVIRLDAQGQFSMLHSSFLDAQALHRMAGITLDDEFRTLTRPQAPAVSIPAQRLPTLAELTRRSK